MNYNAFLLSFHIEKYQKNEIRKKISVEIDLAVQKLVPTIKMMLEIDYVAPHRENKKVSLITIRILPYRNIEIQLFLN